MDDLGHPFVAFRWNYNELAPKNTSLRFSSARSMGKRALILRQKYELPKDVFFVEVKFDEWVSKITSGRRVTYITSVCYVSTSGCPKSSEWLVCFRFTVLQRQRQYKAFRSGMDNGASICKGHWQKRFCVYPWSEIIQHKAIHWIC